jgi:hypothetical protein
MTVGLVGLVSWALIAGPSGAVLPAAGAISNKNMSWVFNWESGVGGDIEFYETKLSDGTLKRYAIYTSMANGFNIVDITDPTLPPIPTGAYVDPGLSWQGDVQVDPVRKLVVSAIESPGTTASLGGDGVTFVSIANPMQPTRVGIMNTTSAHNSTIIGDNVLYTLGGGGGHMIDYTNVAAPVNMGRVRDADSGVTMCSGHDITVDANQPVMYNACANQNTEIWDISDPRSPHRLSVIRDTKIQIAHQADPSPDSSLLVISDERGGGLSATPLPSGGAHIFDISGKYVPGASLTNPLHVGHWFIPFTGPLGDQDSTGQWGNVTMHNMTFQAERPLMSVSWYTAGSWVANMAAATQASGGQYSEWKGNQFGEGGTTWGNTMGNFVPEGSNSWSTKWTRFDDARFDTLLYTNDITRGMDVLRYTGPMPKKDARLTISEDATGGTVTGVLDRYAVWTYEGWVNKPLAGKTITISAGGASATVTTGADGSFSAPLGLGGGSHTVTATWDGDATYNVASVTEAVSA